MPLLALGITNPFILTNPDAAWVKLHWLASAEVFMTVPERQATAVRGVIANLAQQGNKRVLLWNEQVNRAGENLFNNAAKRLAGKGSVCR